MDRTVLISLPVEDLQSLIMDCVNSCLKHYPSLSPKVPEIQPNDLMTVDQAAEFLDLTVPTIYTKTCKRELPFMKRSKRLYFSRAELTSYLKQGRPTSSVEINSHPEDFLKTPRKRRA